MSEGIPDVHIDEHIAEVIDGAFDNGRPIVAAYVDADGRPHLSYRGSTQVVSHNQCAMWIREPAGGLIVAIAQNPRLTMMYRDPESKTTYLIYGRAYLVTDPSIATRIYEKSPKAERDRDPHRAGRAIVIEVDEIQGGPPQARIHVRRRGAL